MYGRRARNLAVELGDLPLARESAHQALRNIGLKLVTATFDPASPESRVLLHHLLSRPCFVHTSTIAGGEYRATFDLFALVAAIHDGMVDDIGDGLTKVKSSANQGHLAQNPILNILAREIITIAQAMI